MHKKIIQTLSAAECFWGWRCSADGVICLNLVVWSLDWSWKVWTLQIVKYWTDPLILKLKLLWILTVAFYVMQQLLIAYSSSGSW